MSLRSNVIFPFFFITLIVICDVSNGQYNTTNDSVYSALLIDHLRNNFDDIHDVSMRFHHMDHGLNGIILLNMRWEKGRLIYSSVARNETNSDEFAAAIIKNLQTWYIKDLIGPFDFSLPIRIKIIGSDDSTFTEKGILTGEIYNNDGKPINYVRLSFRSSDNPSDTLRNCYSNGEGIFVKTLIPTGSWNINFSATGFKKYTLKNVRFNKGDHIRKKIVLQ